MKLIEYIYLPETGAAYKAANKQRIIK